MKISFLGVTASKQKFFTPQGALLAKNLLVVGSVMGLPFPHLVPLLPPPLPLLAWLGCLAKDKA